MRRDHFFDWGGFMFAAKVLVLCILAGTLGRYGLLYAAQSSPGTGPSLVLIQESRPAPKSLSLALSTTTSKHVINTLSISDAVPPSGKFIAADLSAFVLTLYSDGAAIAKYPIQSTGKTGSPYRAPPGFYAVLAKESDRFNAREHIDLPWSVQFYANYFIHGLPYGADGAPLAASDSTSIELNSDDAKSVYEFAEVGTNVFVMHPQDDAPPALSLDTIPLPSVSARAYLVADIDTGDVYAELNPSDRFPLSSATALLTGLAATESIAFDKKVPIPRAALQNTKGKMSVAKEEFFAGDLFYPLLMGGNAAAALALAEAHGTQNFVGWMNATAKALGMESTRLLNTVSTSTENVSTSEDLFRLVAYLTQEKSFILDIAETDSKDIIAGNGDLYRIVSTTTSNTAVSVVPVPINGTERRIAIIVMNSSDAKLDSQMLTDWFTQSALQGAELANTACVSCGAPAPYRKIQF